MTGNKQPVHDVIFYVHVKLLLIYLSLFAVMIDKGSTPWDDGCFLSHKKVLETKQVRTPWNSTCVDKIPNSDHQQHTMYSHSPPATCDKTYMINAIDVCTEYYDWPACM